LTTSPIIFGEVLFDCFPDGESVLGGAPFNVAWHLQGFGLQPRFVSCVGDDTLGHRVIQAMREWGMDTDLLQVDKERPTGKVNIAFDNGEPKYDICADQAYDHILLTPQISAAMNASSWFYYGSLAARSEHNANTLNSLLRLKPKTSQLNYLMDVNLRPPWWQAGFIASLVQAADWVKLNEDELRLLTQANAGASPASKSVELSHLARNYLSKYALQGLIITQGERGAMIMHGEQTLSAPTPKVANLINPVGAGDAFTAAFLLGAIRRWPLAVCLQRAQQFAAVVCETKAATIDDKSRYQSLINQWLA